MVNVWSLTLIVPLFAPIPIGFGLAVKLTVPLPVPVDPTEIATHG